MYAVPGLHYDETWAFTYAHRIATEPGFWPWQGMSPYTSPWTHYWAALWLSWHDSLTMFRASQIFLSCAGIALLALAVVKDKRFFLVVCLSPALILNQRFAIELTGFHVFCAALFLLGLKKRSVILWVLALLLGCTSHILFISVAFAATVWVVLEKMELRASEKRAILVCGILLSGFFLRAAFLIPEKGKALALAVACLACGCFLWWGIPRFLIFPWLRRLFWPSAIFFGLSVFFFFSGAWPLGISTGDFQPWLLVFAPVFCFFFWRGFSRSPEGERLFFLVLLSAAGAMMLKPTPRYYELAFLGVAYFLHKGLVTSAPWQRQAGFVLLAVNALLIYPRYFSQIPQEKALHFLVWKDNSKDFLSKQELARIMGEAGCALSNISVMNSRNLDSLVALARHDWVLTEKKCDKHLLILLPSEVANVSTHDMSWAGYVVRGF